MWIAPMSFCTQISRKKQMKSKIMLSLFSILLAMFVIAGTQNAAAAETSDTPSGARHVYSHHDYHTSNPSYSSWYPSEGTSYVYPGTQTQAGRYKVDYVYTSPTNSFNTWYGNGRSSNSNAGASTGYSSGASGNGRGTGGK